MRERVNNDNALYYLLTDHLGSTYKTIHSTTGVIDELRYMPFGTQRYPDGVSNIPTNYRFTGQLSQMTDTGLYYYGARWYDPGIRTLHPGGQHHPAAGQPAGLGSVCLCVE